MIRKVYEIRVVGTGILVGISWNAAGGGKAFPAFFPEKEIDPVWQTVESGPLSPMKITGLNQLRQELEPNRKTGATYSSGTTIEDLETCLAPVFGICFPTNAGMSPSLPRLSISPEKQKTSTPFAYDSMTSTGNRTQRLYSRKPG